MINDLISRNLHSLSKVAKKIAPKQSHDLLTDTYLQVLNANVPTNDHEFIKYFSRCMSNNFRNQKSTFNQNFVIKEINCNFVVIEDVEQIDKEEVINELAQFKSQLKTHESILFELHFEQGLSYRNIAKLLIERSGYQVSYFSIQALIKPIKDKLICKEWKSLNSWACCRSRGYLSKGQNQRNTSSLF